MKKSKAKVAPRRGKTPRRRPPQEKVRQASQPLISHPSSLSIRRILVPIDFSVHSKNALRYAVPMAEQYHATLTLIYVIEPTIYPADLGFGQIIVPGVEEELRAKSEEELRSIIQTEIGGRAEAEAVVRMGKPHQEILNEAQEKQIDLLILATHGHTGVEQILFGSTAMRVVRLAQCPVMTIRPQAHNH
jgi:nucleotide-binding universal stress UspA family protein